MKFFLTVLSCTMIFTQVAQADCFKIKDVYKGITSPSMGNGKGFLILEGSDGINYGIPKSNISGKHLAKVAFANDLDYCPYELIKARTSRGAFDFIIINAEVKP